MDVGLAILVSLAALAGLAAIAYYGRWVFLLVRQAVQAGGRIEWVDMGPTPLGEKGYTPQGLTWADGRLIFANSWRNTRSRVYEFDPAAMTLLRWFDMPDGAVHTSGLAWTGQHLWAVDFKSNLAYKIDLESSLSRQECVVIGRFETTLRGTSACCIIRRGDEEYLAISDYRRTRRVIFVRAEEALAAGTASGSIAHQYLNEGFSQGLECVDGCIFESENKLGIDIINQMDLERLLESGRSRDATIKQFPAPYRGVEDLAWDGEHFWTTDERSFRFYKGIWSQTDAD